MFVVQRTNKKERVLRPVHASTGLECEYRRRLQDLIRKMDRSVCYWITAAYKANEPEIQELKEEDRELALDAVPANALRRSVRKLARRWQREFNEASQSLAEWFALASHRRSKAQLKQILKKGGWSVKLRLTPAQRDVIQATIHENVSLIRSLPQRYFTEVEGSVMRSVQSGRKLNQLVKDLQNTAGVTERRAKSIARDQNNKATGSLTRVNQLELGIEEAIWMHSHAGKKPRPSHLRNDGERYNVATGWYDPDEKKWIVPGELINCRCFSRSVIPGFS